MTKRLIRCRTRDGGISIGDGARGAKRTSATGTDINEIHRRVWGDLAPDPGLPPSQARTADGRPDINEIHRRVWGDLAPTNDKHSAEPWPR
ncbi:hypothetical protein [Burkholderia gladioli]|uniref:hypothetical protein n=1 Tax=Burkholderia gladioli TaxID=28095 RepID=UPI002656469B|nr:hypothetical protein [Burkholderia gladioli]MDN7754089.1 hypothetical protein [Burkholderia gladioli]